jgi:hypothetical protein
MASLQVRLTLEDRVSLELNRAVRGVRAQIWTDEHVAGILPLAEVEHFAMQDAGFLIDTLAANVSYSTLEYARLKRRRS